MILFAIFCLPSTSSVIETIVFIASLALSSGEFTKMNLCDNTLSWDGILCDLCRRLFDSHVVRIAHERNMCRAKKQDERMNRVPSMRGYLDPVDAWWHDISSLGRCAAHSCKLCELTLSAISSQDLEGLESWQAILPTSIYRDDESAFIFRIWVPWADKRLEAERWESPSEDDYDNVIFQMKIQNDSGETFSTHPFLAADHVL